MPNPLPVAPLMPFTTDVIQADPDTTETTEQPYKRTADPLVQHLLLLQGRKAPTKGLQPPPPNTTCSGNPKYFEPPYHSTG